LKRSAKLTLGFGGFAIVREHLGATDCGVFVH
jgi:hypothetical protein